MNAFLTTIVMFLQDPANAPAVMAAFFGLLAVAAALRAAVCAGYQSQLTIAMINMKEISAKPDIKDTKSGLLNKVMKDYVKAASKGASPDAGLIAAKYVRRLSLMGLSYSGLGRFADGFTLGLPLCGALMCLVFPANAVGYGAGAIGSFVLLKLLDCIFDYALVRDKLTDELELYITGEVARFYAADTGSVLNRLRTELSASMISQAQGISAATDKMGESVAGVLRLGLAEMSKSLEEAAGRLTGVDGALKEPLEAWRRAVSEAAAVQRNLNETCASLDKMLAVSKELAVNYEANNETSVSIQTQLAYIEQNQRRLEDSLAAYEASLERVTSRMADGFGSLVAVHVQNAYDGLNDSLQENIRQILAGNNALVARLTELFESMREQSQSVSRTVINMKEQLSNH